jgi:N-acetylneuraminate lyase
LFGISVIRRLFMKPLQGIVVSLVTPFTADQQVDYRAARRLVRFLLSARVHGLYVTGSAGEWVRLTAEERKELLETVLEETGGRVPVVAHVGHYSTRRAVDLARHAARVKADYVSSVIPGYYHHSLTEVADYYCAIAEAGLPVILYYLEGVGDFDPRAFVERFCSLQGLVGLKYTATDLFPMQAVHQLSSGRFRVWGGHDQMALAALFMNAVGVIGTNYNYIPEIYVELYDAYLAGNLQLAQKLQEEANRVLLAVKQFGDLPAYKAVLALRGLSVGDCRLPTRALNANERTALANAIAPLGDRLKRLESVIRP